MATGKLIVIEGGDAAGKATQALKLTERLARDGFVTELYSFPRYEENTLGRLIRECLDGRRGDFINLDPKIASVLFAVDRFESKEKLMQWLYDGAVVVLDRYVSSNMLHQGAKVANETERKELLAWIANLEHQEFGLPRPDGIFYLNVPALIRTDLLQKHWVERGSRLDVAEIDIVHQEMVDRYASDISSIYQEIIEIKCIEDDQLRSIESIHEEIYSRARDILDA